MTHSDLTRRQVLRRGAAATATVALGANAGCVSNILGGGGSGDYTKWLPEPGTISDTEHYSFTLTDYSALEDDEDEFDEETDFSSVEESLSPAIIDWEDISMYLSFDGVLVVDAEFDREETVGDFEDEDFEEDTTHEGYTVLVGSDEERAVGVGDGTLVDSNWNSTEPVRAVEDVIDTNAGNESRYVDESDDFSTLTNKLGSGDTVRGQTMEETSTDDPESGQFRDMVAEGRALTVNGETTDGKWVLLFNDGDDVDTDDVEDWVDESQSNDGSFENWEDFQYNKSGRAAVIEATIDTDLL